MAGLLNMLRVVFLSVFSIVGLLFFETVLFFGNFMSLVVYYWCRCLNLNFCFILLVFGCFCVVLLLALSFLGWEKIFKKTYNLCIFQMNN